MEENALHFDTHSGIYSDVRPGYPNEVYETISKYKLKNDKIMKIKWNCYYKKRCVKGQTTHNEAVESIVFGWR
jgi:hypothetical protein